MKNTEKLFLCLTAVTAGFFSCKKNNVVAPQNVAIPLDSIATIDTTATNTAFVKVYNQTIGGQAPQPSTYQIDINNDNVFDLQFISSIATSPGGENILSSSIQTLNTNTLIASVQKTDTTCSFVDSFVYESGTYATHYYQNYNASQTYNSSLALQVNTYVYAGGFSDKDFLSSNSHWQTGNLTMAYFNGSSSSISLENVFYYNIHSGPWKTGDRKFIGVKFIDRQDTYYGWLEVGMIDVYNITLYKQTFIKVKT